MVDHLRLELSIIFSTGFIFIYHVGWVLGGMVVTTMTYYHIWKLFRVGFGHTESLADGRPQLFKSADEVLSADHLQAILQVVRQRLDDLEADVRVIRPSKEETTGLDLDSSPSSTFL